jgi:hypothetical protein
MAYVANVTSYSAMPRSERTSIEWWSCRSAAYLAHKIVYQVKDKTGVPLVCRTGSGPSLSTHHLCFEPGSAVGPFNDGE